MKLFIITTPFLKTRIKYINTIQQHFSNIFNLDIEIINYEFTLTDQQIKDKIKLSYSNNQDFDKLITKINPNIVDNILRHKYIYSKIISENIDYAWILEDDVVISNDYLPNLVDFSKIINHKLDLFDIIFTGFTKQNKIDEDINVLDLRNGNNSDIIPSKASYIINNKTAKLLNNYFETYNYTMRIQLSKFLYDNKSIKIGYINKYLLLEASKIGIFPSTINKSNVLMFNPEYIQLIKLLNEPDNLNLALVIFNKLKVINSADVYHIMGIIYHKNKLYQEAQEHFEKALSILKEHNGYIDKDSEILNNCINIFQFTQS